MTPTEAVIIELVKLRKRKAVRQGEVASAIGVTQSRISQVERLRGPIPFELVVGYAGYLGARVAILPVD